MTNNLVSVAFPCNTLDLSELFIFPCIFCMNTGFNTRHARIKTFTKVQDIASYVLQQCRYDNNCYETLIPQRDVVFIRQAAICSLTHYEQMLMLLL